jgi:hypothetical protein
VGKPEQAGKKHRLRVLLQTVQPDATQPSSKTEEHCIYRAETIDSLLLASRETANRENGSTHEKAP